MLVFFKVAEYEATTFSIFYNNSLFLAIVILASFYLLRVRLKFCYIYALFRIRIWIASGFKNRFSGSGLESGSRQAKIFLPKKGKKVKKLMVIKHVDLEPDSAITWIRICISAKYLVLYVDTNDYRHRPLDS
jgi:hypothetical protein